MKKYIITIITLAIIGNNTTIAFEELKDLHEEDAIHEIMQQQYALHQAIKANNDYLVTRLLNKRHYNVNEKDNDGNTPLHLAIDRKNIVELLLKHGADPNIQNNHGLTALHYAALYSTTPEIVRLLLKHKAINPNIQDNNGFTALHYAVLSSNPNIEIIRLLLQHKTTNPNVQDNNGDTALHIIVFRNTPEIVRLLLEHKATNPNIPDRDGRTALHIAVFSNKPEIIKLLLEHNADQKIKDKEGKTPLDYAIERKHKEIQNLIEEHIKQYKIKRNAIIKDSLSSRLPSLPINLIGEYMGDENPLQKRLLSAINTNNIDEVNAVLSHNVEITGDILKAAQDRIEYLKKHGTAQSSRDIENARTILTLLTEHASK